MNVGVGVWFAFQWVTVEEGVGDRGWRGWVKQGKNLWKMDLGLKRVGKKVVKLTIKVK